ncbi:MAG: hypothetical protein HKN94_13005 [Acidimicrobiales bacterium]|nr:hypothetical protein [Acidimicrobiales bacterium]
MTRRTKTGLGIGLVLLGLVLLYNYGIASLANSPLVGDYRLSDPLTVDVSSGAVVTNDLELLRFNNLPDFVSTPDDVRVEAVSAGSGELFLGIAPSDTVAEYLDGVPYDEITAWDSTADDISEVEYTRNEGTADLADPGDQDFWVASVSGRGEQTLDWTIESGDWAVVIMNADGSPGVSTNVQFGVRLPNLVPIGLTSLAFGLVALIGGTRLVTSLPPRPGERPRWTLRGRSVPATTVEGRVAALCAVLTFIPFTSGAMFGAPIFLFLAVRKGDRGLLLLLPLLVSLLPIGLIGILVWLLLGG